MDSKEINVLNISCGFECSKVYRELFNELNKINVKLSVYAPLHEYEKIDDAKYEYAVYINKIIKKHDKFLYFSKIHKMKKDIEKSNDLVSITLIHAHSWFSDGAVAYELYMAFL